MVRRFSQSFFLIFLAFSFSGFFWKDSPAEKFAGYWKDVREAVEADQPEKAVECILKTADLLTEEMEKAGGRMRRRLKVSIRELTAYARSLTRIRSGTSSRIEEIFFKAALTLEDHLKKLEKERLTAETSG